MPCCGHPGVVACPGVFDVDQLENALGRSPPIRRVECIKSFAEVNIADLLFGLSENLASELEERIQDIIQWAPAHLIELHELTALAQRSFSRSFSGRRT